MQKILLGALTIALLAIPAAAFSQEISFGTPAVQIVKITISENGDAHVTHVVEPSKQSRHLDLIRDDFTNLQVTDENGGSPQYAETGTERYGLLIFPTDDKVFVDYDVAGAVTQKDGMWTWDYMYLATTQFYLPEQVELVFLNENPLHFVDQKGISCHGCQVKLEYELETTQTTRQIQWQDKKFDLTIISQAKIPQIKFDQPAKSLSFEVTETDEYITLIIPLELLWNPYEVFLDGEKIHKTEFFSDGTNVWLNFKPTKAGTIEIVGVSAVPEFPLMGVMILGVAMILAAKFGKFNRR
ncbi:MAG TPA: hypothetical protein VNK44_06425 [Candidatus Nitrosotenuis sp.]|nr:hypothetical protein [Candidatus Nitrosotenuis sp.]